MQKKLKIVIFTKYPISYYVKYISNKQIYRLYENCIIKYNTLEYINLFQLYLKIYKIDRLSNNIYHPIYDPIYDV